MSTDDAACPECGGPVSATSSYCMHCYADLDDPGSETPETGDVDGTTTESDTSPGFGTGETAPDSGTGESAPGPETRDSPPEFDTEEDAGDPLLDPDGLADNTLTVAVGIVGGIVVGFLWTMVFAGTTGMTAPILLGGGIAWIGSTVYLARRRTVQKAVATAGYAVAGSLLAFPFTAFGPVVEATGLGERVHLFLGSLAACTVLAAIAAGIGLFASRYVSDDAGN